MALSIHPTGSLLTVDWLRRNREAENQSLERLATGRRINRGSDDPAGLIASEQLEAQIKALEAESEIVDRLDANANIADGHMSQLSSLAGDLQALLVKGGNTAGMSEAEAAANQMQIDSIVSSIQRFAGDAAGSLGTVGLPGTSGADAAAALQAAAAGLSPLTTGGGSSLASGDLEAGQAAVTAAMEAFNTTRGQVGAFQKYDLAARKSAAAVGRENLLAANSRIRDTDFAAEVSSLVRAQTLSAASIETLRISNQTTRSVLALLR